jgi:hypothetical protein
MITIYILIYLSICALITIFVPAVRNQWKEFVVKSIPQCYKDIDWNIDLNSLQKAIKKIMISLLLGICVCLFFVGTVVFLPFLIKNDKKRVSSAKATTKDFDTNLYFSHMGGAGTIHCLECSYQEEIISFIHGFDEKGHPAYGTKGLQCQSCGKFYSLNFDEQIEKRRQNIKSYCACGGILEDDKPIFCPQCNSRNVKYNMSYIT